MKKIELRPNGTKRVFTVNNLPSKADQSFKEDCDVNIILQRFMKTRQWPGTQKTGSYSDVSEIPDLLNAHLQLREAEEAFAKLPAVIRKKMQNNPLMLEEYLANPENLDEAIEHGLLKPRKKEKSEIKKEAKNKTTNEPKKASDKKTDTPKSEPTDA